MIGLFIQCKKYCYTIDLIGSISYMAKKKFEYIIDDIKLKNQP